ncbi:alpha/beta hydrolase [Lutimonas saemankumensis]|uniref:alpha/beta hydrolase family protein n=1 Tax=Lutimonas saemankumensis TaxID=483016 RepID=UPI001CD4A6EE|nr:prolyl oligopeptidase family serine peptidase [Lutimonas saemankumensis]MCA0932793.1 alpha/beta hydrolase [Lutimonas saemankumensis]
MKKIKNLVLEGSHDRPILIDLFYPENQISKDVVVFCHGYKGYKDWGAWELVAEKFAQNNYFFVKMNFSHNGGTVDQPIDFPDLEAFGLNNFLIELDDLDTVISWICSDQKYSKEKDVNRISVIGHSRGGGIVALKGASDERIKKIISWAGVSDFGSRFPEGDQLEQWKKKGVAYITNSRTNQQMPHYIQFYDTFKENEAKLTIRTAVSNSNIPYLILHGDEDETVSVTEARNLGSWSENSSLKIISGANHTFGSSHPWENTELPEHLSEVVHKTLEFLKA